MLKYIRNICGWASGIILIGTAGSSDCNTITNVQINYLLATAIALAVVSWLCHRIIILRRRVKFKRQYSHLTALPKHTSATQRKKSGMGGVAHISK